MEPSTKLEVKQHYERLLAEHYTWMFGVEFEAKVAEQRAVLERALGSTGAPSGTCVDLGCGPGFQSIALAQMGAAKVIAFDTSAALLQELDTHKAGLPISTVQDDIAGLSQVVEPGSALVIACMGDTLTHLASKAAVVRLFADARSALKPGGRLVLTFRDLSGAVEGLDRFIPVRSDADKIMTCFLEFVSPDAVRVHDLIHVRDAKGWTLHKSSYSKLRLPVAWVAEQLDAAGFRVVLNEPAGRLTMVVARA